MAYKEIISVTDKDAARHKLKVIYKINIPYTELKMPCGIVCVSLKDDKTSNACLLDGSYNNLVARV